MRETKKLSRQCVVLSLWLIAAMYFGFGFLDSMPWFAFILFFMGIVFAVKLVIKGRWLVKFKMNPVLTRSRFLSYEAKKALGMGERMRRKIGGIFN